MPNNSKKIIFAFMVVFLLSTFYFLFSDSVVSAAEPTKLTYEFPCSPIAGGICPTSEQTAQSPAAYIARFYQFALMLAGMLAFGMIIYGAIQYIVSAGSPAAQSDARDRIFQALWGIALLFGAYLILYTIDPKLVSLTDPNINFPTNTETSPSATSSVTLPPMQPPQTPTNPVLGPTPAPNPNPNTSPSIPTTPISLPPVEQPVNLSGGLMPGWSPGIMPGLNVGGAHF